MKKLESILLLFFSCFLFMPFDSAYAQRGPHKIVTDMSVVPPHQEVVPDTVKDPHSKLTAKYRINSRIHCTAILISSTAALTAKHCVKAKQGTPAGTIYPGASGPLTPFGYMNISSFVLHPKYDIALLKGTERDQDKFYKYYIKKFKTIVTGYTDQELHGFENSEVYSYGYPYKTSTIYQYRSDGNLKNYVDSFKFFYSDLPAYGGQSGSGVFKKDSQFVGIIIESTTVKHEAIILPFTEEIANWINTNAN